jgi:alanyl-tRNA synthetase
VKVYSKELDLQTAQKIPGLRAVFGESYPDPVRVVTLEYDVNSIASDIENPKWRNTSVEFCGGTHVAKTGDIKDFVIVEESGIAKGIRRVIAVTGHEAADAKRTADTLKARLDSLETASGKSKDAGLKALTVELGQADISLITKNQLRDRLAVIRKAFDKEIKDREAAANKAALEEIQKYFQENPNDEIYIASVPVNGNAKALSGIVLAGKKLGKNVYVISGDEDAGKVAHANFVTESSKARGLDAQTWASKVSDILGGKAGGKSDSAQGSGTNVEKIAEAVSVARSYAEKFLSK